MPCLPTSYAVASLPSAALAFALTLAVAPASSASATGPTPELIVEPGSVVRWSGAGTVACGAGGESWPPLGESCFYPLDLLAPAGEVEVWRQVGEQRRHGRVRVGDYPYDVQRITLSDDRHVDLAPADLARAEREAARVAELWQLRTPRRFSLPLAPPLARLPSGSGGRFGARRIINGEPRSPHTGADYAAATGTPVLAAAAGTVVLAEEHFFAGKSVFVDHGDGLVSMVFHLSGIAVAPGDEVAAGEILGLVGATGRATGPHLHFGLRWRGARVDPALLLADPDDLPALVP